MAGVNDASGIAAVAGDGGAPVVSTVVVSVADGGAGSAVVCSGDFGLCLPPPKIDFGFGLKGVFSPVVAESGLANGVCLPPNTEYGLAWNGVPELSCSMFATGFGGR